MSPSRERYGLVGTGARAGMYLDALTGPHADRVELVALADRNPTRLDHYERELRELGRPMPRRFDGGDVAGMVREARLDRLVVTTPDSTHAAIASAALRAGADVVIEKPLTIDEEGVRELRAAAAESGREIVTTFNYRYSPRNAALKQVVAEGSIGAVTSVHFEWVLDTVHGADYFRRWHRDKAGSGGLLVHKAAHHFDLVNWWIGAAPARVFASGGLRFYGAENARRRGLGPRPARGTATRGSDVAAAPDPFALDLRDDPRLESLYLQAEHHDGYVRDRDVFAEGIGIEDNLSLVVDYDTGASMSYALNAHSPWEGYRVAVNGTEGRAELEVVERGAVERDADGRFIVDPSATPVPGGADPVRPFGERLIVQRHWERARDVPIPAGVGGHGGGDAVLIDHLVRRVRDDAPLHRVAGVDDGVRAVAVGIAGNRSLATGRAVRIDELDLEVAP